MLIEGELFFKKKSMLKNCCNHKQDNQKPLVLSYGLMISKFNILLQVKRFLEKHYIQLILKCLQWQSNVMKILKFLEEKKGFRGII